MRVTSEIGKLKRVLIHSPDSGLGKVVPSKAQDWLFEDIVHLDSIRRKEYDYYVQLLLYFLDPGRIRGRLHEISDPAFDRSFYKPADPGFHASSQVVELQWLLGQILEDREIRLRLISSVCAIENCSYQTERLLFSLSAAELANVFITGSVSDGTMLFPPIPNFIFTRDIGIVVHDHFILNKPAKKVRHRETLLAKYIFFHHPYFRDARERILELPNDFHRFLLPSPNHSRRLTFEGGDVMVVSPEHVLIGVSERTTIGAAHRAVHILFERNLARKVSIIRIPRKRDYMHIDTVFTQVKRNVWVMLGLFSRKAVRKGDADPVERVLTESDGRSPVRIWQFNHKDLSNPRIFDNVEDLLSDISERDLGSGEKTRFIYSGNNEFPFDAREQWTDSCNLLALREGVVLGYDRNDKTAEAFRNQGFRVVQAAELVRDFESGRVHPDELRDVLIQVPSAELSRARGGFHCMSLPLEREDLD